MKEGMYFLPLKLVFILLIEGIGGKVCGKRKSRLGQPGFLKLFP